VDNFINKANAENAGNQNQTQIKIDIGGEDEFAGAGLGNLLLVIAGVMYVIALCSTIISYIPSFLAPILFIGGSVFGIIAIALIIISRRKAYILNKLASLIVSSELRSIPDIARLSSMSEMKVIDSLRILISDSSSLKLGNDARYLKGAKMNLQTMEITLSDKYIEKEPWECAYCHSINEVTILVCRNCRAAKQKS